MQSDPPSENLFRWHKEQLADPLAAEKVPLGQFLQGVPAFEYLLIGQSWHQDDPSAELVPAVQRSHMPPETEKYPARHRSHDVIPYLGCSVPALQLVHPVVVLSFEKVSGGHCAQLESPANEDVPGLQIKQLVCLASGM
jgi:hypothetical protein